MRQICHGSATTTHAVQAPIQRSQASIAELSRELGLNPKTVAKWHKRQTIEDRNTGPKEPRSTILCEEEEAMVVAFQRHTLLPLDDGLYALLPSIPHLTRSSLHRCLQRHGIRTAHGNETNVGYMTFPAQHRTKLHSTNPIERLNGEIKRRTDVVGIFPNEASIRRLVGAIRMEQTEEWTVQRARYMTLETLAPVCDDLSVSLPAAQSD